MKKLIVKFYVLLFLISSVIFLNCAAPTGQDYLDGAETFYSNYKSDIRTAENTNDAYYKQSFYDFAKKFLGYSIIFYMSAKNADPPIKDSILYNSNYCWACEAYAKNYTEGTVDNYSLAIACHEKRVELFPDDANSYGWLIDLYHRIGNYSKAIEYAELLLPLIPSKDSTYNLNYVYEWLIFLYDETDNFAKVIEHGEKYVLLDKTDGDFLYKIASAYEKTENTEKATEFYIKAAKLKNDKSINWLKSRNIEY